MDNKSSKVSAALSALREKQEDEKDGGKDEAQEEASEKKGLKLASIARKLTEKRMKAKDGVGGPGKKKC